MERVLVCLLASTRAHQLTFARFKRHVLDELNADLALALAIDENYDYLNPYWQHAKYRWTAPGFLADFGEAYDSAQRWLCQERNVSPPDWRLMLQIAGIWQGGIRSPKPQQSKAAILPFCRWLLLQGLRKDEILDRYDRFVITRSDFFWLCPHPPLSILDREAIWAPSGDDHGGLNDRHLVASRADVENCLNVIEDLLLHPVELYEEIRPKTDWLNSETFLAYHLERKGLLQKVRRFPYVMYLARPVNDDSPTWTWGAYEGTAGHYVKYQTEFRAASAYATIIHSRADWEAGTWRQFDANSVAPRSISLWRQLRYACESSFYRLVSALRRPNRLARFGKWMVSKRMSGSDATDATSGTGTNTVYRRFDKIEKVSAKTSGD